MNNHNDLLDKKKLLFYISCIFDYAEMSNINYKDSYFFLKENKCIQYLIENYDIEHTLSKEDTLEALTYISNNNSVII